MISLNNKGHINYFGFDSLGIVGIIDASECPPTYGASENNMQFHIKLWFQMLLDIICTQTEVTAYDVFNLKLYVPIFVAVDDVRGFVKGGFQLLRNKEGDLEEEVYMYNFFSSSWVFSFLFPTELQYYNNK